MNYNDFYRIINLALGIKQPQQISLFRAAKKVYPSAPEPPSRAAVEGYWKRVGNPKYRSINLARMMAYLLALSAVEAAGEDTPAHGKLYECWGELNHSAKLSPENIQFWIDYAQEHRGIDIDRRGSHEHKAI